MVAKGGQILLGQKGQSRVAFPLTAKYPSKTESKLMNEYQSAMLGLLDESYKKPYEDFLKDRLAIRNMIDADAETYNIPTDL